MVASIVSAFATGMDIFKRMKAKQRPKRSKKKPDRFTEEEWRLQTSLQYRPQEIRAEYDRNLARLGHRFAIGDSAAQTSLNHTLLILNTGLIRILSYALSNDTKARALSRRSLLSLSESAAAEAVRALEQLQSRLSSNPQLNLTASTSSNRKAQRKSEESPKPLVASNKARPAPKPRSKSFSITERKRPGPDPLLRGAWVRSRSGTSATTVSSTSGTSTPKTIEAKGGFTSLVQQDVSLSRHSHHRTRSSPHHSSRSNHDESPNHLQENHPFYQSQSPPCYVAYPEQQGQHPSPRRQPSLLLASPEVFTDLQTPSFQSSTPPIPPPKIPLYSPLPSQNNPPLPPLTTSTSIIRPRPRPPSVATFTTASTKIGEIPEHRWLINYNHNNLPDPNRPLPPWEDPHNQKSRLYTIPPRLEDEPVAKRKGRGFRFWKRSE